MLKWFFWSAKFQTCSNLAFLNKCIYEDSGLKNKKMKEWRSELIMMTLKTGPVTSFSHTPHSVWMLCVHTSRRRCTFLRVGPRTTGIWSEPLLIAELRKSGSLRPGLPGWVQKVAVCTTKCWRDELRRSEKNKKIV